MWAGTPGAFERGVTSMSEVVLRALGAQFGACSPWYPFVHLFSLLEQLVSEEQHNEPLALEAQPVATRPKAPECPAPVGWDLVM